MSGSSIRCTQDQRWEIVQLKRELKQLFGFEPVELLISSELNTRWG